MCLHQLIPVEPAIRTELLKPELAMRTLRHFTVERAIRYLAYILMEESRFAYNDNPISFDDLLCLVGTSAKASSVYGSFVGGPKSNTHYYYGSFLMYFVDRFMHAIAAGENKKVDEFLKSLRGQ
jgi:hypothetical protein